MDGDSFINGETAILRPVKQKEWNRGLLTTENGRTMLRQNFIALCTLPSFTGCPNSLPCHNSSVMKVVQQQSLTEDKL